MAILFCEMKNLRSSSKTAHSTFEFVSLQLFSSSQVCSWREHTKVQRKIPEKQWNWFHIKYTENTSCLVSLTYEHTVPWPNLAGMKNRNNTLPPHFHRYYGLQRPTNFLYDPPPFPMSISSLLRPLYREYGYHSPSTDKIHPWSSAQYWPGIPPNPAPCSRDHPHTGESSRSPTAAGKTVALAKDRLPPSTEENPCRHLLQTVRRWLIDWPGFPVQWWNSSFPSRFPAPSRPTGDDQLFSVVSPFHSVPISSFSPGPNRSDNPASFSPFSPFHPRVYSIEFPHCSRHTLPPSGRNSYRLPRQCHRHRASRWWSSRDPQRRQNHLWKKKRQKSKKKLFSQSSNQSTGHILQSTTTTHKCSDSLMSHGMSVVSRHRSAVMSCKCRWDKKVEFIVMMLYFQFLKRENSNGTENANNKRTFLSFLGVLTLTSQPRVEACLGPGTAFSCSAIWLVGLPPARLISPQSRDTDTVTCFHFAVIGRQKNHVIRIKVLSRAWAKNWSVVTLRRKRRNVWSFSPRKTNSRF